MPLLTVRYYAAARAAAQTTTETVEADCVDDALTALRARHDERFTAVVAVSSLLLDGVQVHELRDRLRADAALDVLPPFAGG